MKSSNQLIAGTFYKIINAERKTYLEMSYEADDGSQVREAFIFAHKMPGVSCEKDSNRLFLYLRERGRFKIFLTASGEVRMLAGSVRSLSEAVIKNKLKVSCEES